MLYDRPVHSTRPHTYMQLYYRTHLPFHSTLISKTPRKDNTVLHLYLNNSPTKLSHKLVILCKILFSIASHIGHIWPVAIYIKSDIKISFIHSFIPTTSANAVTLVWGSLRLAPKSPVLWVIMLTFVFGRV